MAPVPRPVLLYTFRDGDSVASLCGPFPSLITLSVKKSSFVRCPGVTCPPPHSSGQRGHRGRRPVWVRGLCRPRGSEHIPPAPSPALCTEVQHRQRWPRHVCVTAPLCPKTQQVSLLMSTFILFFFLFLKAALWGASLCV